MLTTPRPDRPAGLKYALRIMRWRPAVSPAGPRRHGAAAGVRGQANSATRPCSAAGSPMCTSAPSGPAISSRSIAPTVVPVTRLITSPARNPNVLTW